MAHLLCPLYANGHLCGFHFWPLWDQCTSGCGSTDISWKQSFWIPWVNVGSPLITLAVSLYWRGCTCSFHQWILPFNVISHWIPWFCGIVISSKLKHFYLEGDGRLMRLDELMQLARLKNLMNMAGEIAHPVQSIGSSCKGSGFTALTWMLTLSVTSVPGILVPSSGHQ